MKMCIKCKANLNESDRFCPYCGADNSNYQKSSCQEYNNNHQQNFPVSKRNPIAALVLEGIGLLFAIIGILQYIDELKKPEYMRNDQTIGPIVFFFVIGAILLIISFIMFKVFKKNNELEGFAVAGYIVSIISFILVIVLIVAMIAMIMISAFLVANVLSSVPHA